MTKAGRPTVVRPTVISWALTVVALLPRHVVTVSRCDGTSCEGEGAGGYRRPASRDSERGGEDDIHHVFDHPTDFTAVAKVLVPVAPQAPAKAPVPDTKPSALAGRVDRSDAGPPRLRPMASRASRTPPAF